MNSFGDYISSSFDGFLKWNSSRNFKQPKPLDESVAEKLISSGLENKPRATARIEKSEHVAPYVTITPKTFDKSAWGPNEPPIQAEPDDYEAMKAMINSGSSMANANNNATISEDMKELLKKLADVNEQSLSAVQQTNNYLRTISENTQGERNS